MKIDYSNKTAEELELEQEKLHKKLRIPNILILIISLISLITLLFGPALKIQMKVDGSFFSSVISSANDSNNEEPDETMVFIFKDVHEKIVFSATPIDMLSAITSSKEGVKSFMKNMFSSLTYSMENIYKQAFPAMLALNVCGYLYGGLPENSEQISTEAFKEITNLLAENKVDEATSKLPGAFKTFALEELDENLSEDEVNELTDICSSIINKGVDDDTFSFTTLITAMSSEGEENPLKENNPIDEMLKNFDNMDESTLQGIQLGLTATSSLILLSAFCWFMLALLSFIHIFTKNKKVAMWYVKLTGLLPCLLFVIVPTILVAILPKVAEDAQMITNFGLTFGGLTIVSAICLLILWIISIFWCHPIKKKIKACQNALKA